MSKVPTLTEVVEPQGRPLAGGVTLPSIGGAGSESAGQWVDAVMDRMAPQVDALISSRLRDVLAPAVQDAVQAAVEDAIERSRGPLVDALEARLRDSLEQEIARRLPKQRAGGDLADNNRIP
jgi:hypothetical protein